MISEAAISTCNCTLWDATDTTVRLCSDHHRYHRGPKQLVSVTKIIKTLWPVKPDFSRAPPAVLENARDRGIVVDSLFSAYVNDMLDKIPHGTRKDAVLLFNKVRRWWDGHVHDNPRAQVILADDEIAGQCDILDVDRIYDLKTTYNVEDTYPLQLAAYGDLHFATFHRPVKKLAIIHVTERYPEPKIIPVDITRLQDWMAIREMWRLIVKMGADKKIEKETAS